MAIKISNVEWIVDEAGYLVSPSGTRVAKITSSAIWLYDKRIKTDLPFTLEDWGVIANILSLPARPGKG